MKFDMNVDRRRVLLVTWVILFAICLTLYLTLYVKQTSVMISAEKIYSTCMMPNLQIENFVNYVKDIKVVYDFITDNPKPKNNDTKIVLWYDTHGKSLVNDTTLMQFNQCEYKNCQFKHYFTRDNPLLKRPFDADAILVQSGGIFTNSPPPRRNENQVFVLGVRDGWPRTTIVNRSEIGMKWMGVFNWTMTYRLDSDIVYKYSSILKREDTRCLKGKDYDQIFAQKQHSATWVVSHCQTRSQREHYVMELRKVTNVSIYGYCGQVPPCPKESTECFEELALKHKFYIAFENTLYEDYVTEKVFNWFNEDIIIVVRGASNYSRILPPGTVIDAADFKSPHELGHYLNELGKDNKRYTDFLRHKDKYYSTHKLVETQNANCKLCEYLNNLDSHRKTYNNIAEWWLQNWRNWDITAKKLDGFGWHKKN